MTTEEAKSLYAELFVAFPGYRDWLAKTETPTKTHGVWCRMLETVPLPAAKQAVDRMISGDLDMPQAYERDRLPLMIKSYASRIDQDERERRRAARESSEWQRASEGLKSHPYKYGLSGLLKEARQLGADLRDGKIDRDEHDSRMAVLDDKVRERN